MELIAASAAVQFVLERLAEGAAGDRALIRDAREVGLERWECHAAVALLLELGRIRRTEADPFAFEVVPDAPAPDAWEPGDLVWPADCVGSGVVEGEHTWQSFLVAARARGVA